MCARNKITLAKRLRRARYREEGWPYCGVPIQRLTMHVSLCRLGKNRITSEGGKCLALAVKNSTSIIDVG